MKVCIIQFRSIFIFHSSFSFWNVNKKRSRRNWIDFKTLIIRPHQTDYPPVKIFCFHSFRKSWATPHHPFCIYENIFRIYCFWKRKTSHVNQMASCTTNEMKTNIPPGKKYDLWWNESVVRLPTTDDECIINWNFIFFENFIKITLTHIMCRTGVCIHVTNMPNVGHK